MGHWADAGVGTQEDWVVPIRCYVQILVQTWHKKYSGKWPGCRVLTAFPCFSLANRKAIAIDVLPSFVLVSVILSCQKHHKNMSSMADFYIDNGIDPTDFDSFDNFVDMHTATTPTPKLNLDHVRQLAATADLKEIYCNEDSKVISFVPRSDHSPTKRINIYWTTGTVGTCVLHPKQGHTQAFRRDVTPSLLEELMLNPRMHTNTTYQRKRARGGSSSSSFRGGASTGDPADEES
jgi:hypothetical protein